MRATQPLTLLDKAKRDEHGPATEQIHAPAIEKNDQLAPEGSPNVRYTLEVDGRPKSEHATQETALTAALELKRKFPHIRVAIVDAKGSNRIAVELPQASN